MSPSGGDRKQGRRRAAVLKQGTNRLGQVVEIEFVRPEDAQDLRRLKREGSKSLQAVVGIGIGPCLARSRMVVSGSTPSTISAWRSTGCLVAPTALRFGAPLVQLTSARVSVQTATDPAPPQRDGWSSESAKQL